MRKSKQNASFWQRQTLPFIALWAASHTAAWFGAWWLITQANIYNYVSNNTGLSILIAVITLLPALIQIQLVERMIGQSMRRWMFYSLFGTVMSIGIVTSATEILRDDSVIPMALAIMLPIAILQMIWLQRRVHSAWLWILASIVGSILFALPFRDTLGVTFAMVPAGLLYGLLQGSIMRHLLTLPKDTEKAKVDFATDAHEGERLERLQEPDSNNPLWETGDHPTLKSKA